MQKKKTKRMHVLVRGNVQGVGFRYFVYQTGLNLNLKGWVRNRVNGEVEIFAEGSDDILEVFLREVSKGPQMARVENVRVEWQSNQDELPPFTILTTR